MNSGARLKKFIKHRKAISLLRSHIYRKMISLFVEKAYYELLHSRIRKFPSGGIIENPPLAMIGDRNASECVIPSGYMPININPIDINILESQKHDMNTLCGVFKTNQDECK